MNIRDLKYLVAVADYGHFGKAADACFVSQPGLSMQIKKLEKTLGVQLLERNNKSVLLTEMGKTIIEHARDILHRIDVMQEISHQAKDPFSGKLRLGIIPTLAPYLLPLIVPILSEQFPKLVLYLTEETTANILKKLYDGKLDAALLALPMMNNDLIENPLFNEEFLLAVPPQHSLAKLKKAKLSDLSKKALLLLEDGHCLRDQALSICHQAHATEAIDFRATSLETLRHMVAANAGITLMPKLACRLDDNIHYLSFTEPKPARIIGMIWRKSTAKTILLNNIVEYIKKIMRQQSNISTL